MGLAGEIVETLPELGCEPFVAFIIVLGLLYWRTGKTYVPFGIALAVAALVYLFV